MSSILDGPRVDVPGLPDALQAYRLPAEEAEVQGGDVALWNPEKGKWAPATLSDPDSLARAYDQLAQA